jgi:hypothetical protein
VYFREPGLMSTVPFALCSTSLHNVRRTASGGCVCKRRRWRQAISRPSSVTC